MRMRVLGFLVGLGLLGAPIAQAQDVPPAPDLPRQVETLQILLDRTKGEADRCRTDYADLLYQARKINTDYQKLAQETKKTPGASEAAGPASSVAGK